MPLRRSEVPLLQVFATAAERTREARRKNTAQPEADSWAKKGRSGGGGGLMGGAWKSHAPPGRTAAQALQYQGTIFSHSANMTAYCVPARPGPRRREPDTAPQNNDHCPV